MIFTPELAEKVMRGEKTATRRLLSYNPHSPWHRRSRSNYNVGQVFAVQPGRGKRGIGKARCTAVYQQRLGEVSARDAWREGFRDLAEFHSAFKEINGPCRLLDLIWVVEFELVKETG